MVKCSIGLRELKEIKMSSKCTKCLHRAQTFDEWVFRRSPYSTCCPNTFEEVSKYCNGVYTPEALQGSEDFEDFGGSEGPEGVK